VLLEDFAALIGLVLALLGVSLTMITDDPVWDGIGTLSIGVLLGCVAVVLAVEMKGLLIGEAASRQSVDAIRAALVDGTSVLRVIHLKTLHLGPDELLVAAKIAVAPGLGLPAVARAIDEAEVRVRAVEPLARQLYLEPDLDRGGTP
jgi:divalent metal cation (Fe/Co/Zn/Cd) transporter